MNSILNAYLKIIRESEESQKEFGRFIPDDADVEKEILKAIASKECIAFNYTSKDGSKFKMSVIPVEIFENNGKLMLKCYKCENEEDLEVTNEDEAKIRTIYIDSIGEKKEEDLSDEING